MHTLLVKERTVTNLEKTDLERQAPIHEGKFNSVNEKRLWKNLQQAINKIRDLLKENSELKENINQIMQRLKYIEETNITESEGREYFTDEEELERETDWILKSRRKSKKKQIHHLRLPPPPTGNINGWQQQKQ